MKVLVTGGAGYVGSKLVKQLSLEPTISELIIYDNLNQKNHNIFFSSIKNSEKIKFIIGDILDSRKLKPILERVDIVYHLAAKVSTPFGHEEPHIYEQINHWGTAELGYLIEKSEVKKVIYTSSASIYGFSDNLQSELDLPNPTTAYGISKLNGEKSLSQLTKQDVYVLRCGNVYGFGQSIRFDAVINRFMFECIINKRISVSGDGNQFRTFIHIDSIVGSLIKIIKLNLDSGIYNLTDYNFTINQITKVFKKIFNDVEILFINQDIVLKSLRLNPNQQISDIPKDKYFDIIDNLNKFKSNFAFHV